MKPFLKQQIRLQSREQEVEMSLKEIRSRIGSVKNTQQITRAMRMVSAAKLRRAQDNIVNLRPYASRILNTISDVAATKRISHKLLKQNSSPQKILTVVMTSDRGLCGGFNASVAKSAYQFVQENESRYEVLDVLFVGKKGREFFRARGYKKEPVDVILNLAREVSYPMAADVAERLMESFVQGGYDSVVLIYNEFKSAITQDLTQETLLPVDVSNAALLKQEDSHFSKDLIFELPLESMIDELLHKHFSVQVYRVMCESVAAEHAARMTAMENATNNASDMIKVLTLTYNKLRQAAITTELTEISSGAEALKA